MAWPRESLDLRRIGGNDQWRRSRRRSQSLACILLLVILLLSGIPRPLHAQNDPPGRLLALINQVRRNEGLAPLGHSTLLTQAAQRHAEDLVNLDQVTHEGSDGSSYQQRIREARYQAWNDGLMVNEVLWAGLGTAEDALTWFRSNPEWNVLTDPRYREIGIGYSDDGGVRHFVVDVGSRPGVLPIFINDGAPTTEFSQVALRLTNEEAVPLGEGAWMGRAIEVRLSNTPDFEGVPWQPWEPLLPWVLAGEEPGDYAVYVEFRDGADRTAIAEDTIRLVPPGESPPTPTPFLDLGSVIAEPTSELTEPGEVTPPDSTDAPADATSVPPSPPSSGAATPVPEEIVAEGYPTWTPLPSDMAITPEKDGPDWPLFLAFAFQAAALILGVAAFLRRR
ncbi:MAG: CAP domain-containing protein [Anaerolineae bacterium]